MYRKLKKTILTLKVIYCDIPNSYSRSSYRLCAVSVV